MTIPKLSIIVPAKNERKYINILLKSLLNQEFKDFEVIFVIPDNDPTRKFIENFFKNNTPFFDWKIVSDPGKGPGEARNVGVDYARGKYVLFLDADVFLRKNTLKVLIESLNSNSCTCHPLILPILNVKRIRYKFFLYIWSLIFTVIATTFNLGKRSTTMCLMTFKDYAKQVRFKYNWFLEDMEFTYRLYLHTKKKNKIVFHTILTCPRREFGNQGLIFFFKKTLPSFIKKVYYFYNIKKLENDYQKLVKLYPEIR